MKRTLKATLSVDSLNRLKDELLNYRDSLSVKCQKIVMRLAEIGVNVAQSKIDESPLGKRITLSTNISADKMGCNGILLAKGEVKEQEGYAPFSVLLAVEFGAGIRYNPTPNPLIAEKDFPYGVGTFPGQTHAYQDMWWFWDDKANKWRASSGVKATMPMYSASTEIRNNLLKIAKEVFNE
ncbi:MAG: hypothetical protein ACI4EU_03010 [Butyrivibrio sp.]